MILGRRSPWVCVEDLREALVGAGTVAEAVEYAGETLIINRVVTARQGSYFLVVESDLLSPEDMAALRELSEELRADWRTKCVESDHHGRPHPDMPWSDYFTVHLVHAECPEVGRARPFIEPSHTAKVAAFIKPGPWVRHKEDVPHEAALPDLYGLAVRREEIA